MGIKQKESELLVQIKWLLALLKRLGMLDYTRIHVMPIIRGWEECDCGRKVPILSKNPEMRGFADVEIVVGGRVGYMETKVKNGILSEDQETFRDNRTRVGCLYSVVRTFDESISFLRRMGVPVDGVLKGLRPVNSSSCGIGFDSPGNLCLPGEEGPAD